MEFTIAGHWIEIKQALTDDWEPVNEPLTFDIIRRKCVAGETLLIDEMGVERLYIGFNRVGSLVTDREDKGFSNHWRKEEIEKWRIGGK